MLYKYIPFAINEQGYSAKEKIAIFAFHDTTYIPPNLLPYALNIPGNSALVKKVAFEIRDNPVVIRAQKK